MPWQLVIVAFLGVSFGSFINVLAIRYSASGGKLSDRSACPHCSRELSWWELVPIISFLWLRGRCSTCRGKISWQYPLVETVTALAWIWTFTPWPRSGSELVAALASAAILSTLLVLFLIDRRLMLLPDLYLVYLFIFVVLRIWVIPLQAPQAQFGGLIIGAGFLLVLWLITSGRGIGFGDIKLMIPLGLLFGIAGTATLLWLAFVAGGAVAAYLLLTRRATLKSAVPFGPFLIGAAAAVLMWPGLPQLLFAPFAV